MNISESVQMTQMTHTLGEWDGFEGRVVLRSGMAIFSFSEIENGSQLAWPAFLCYDGQPVHECLLSTHVSKK